MGCGPVEGWISTRLDQRPLAELDVEPGVEPSAMAEDLPLGAKAGGWPERRGPQQGSLNDTLCNHWKHVACSTPK